MLTEEEKNAGLEGRIIPVNIEQQMKSAYIDYSMSVIVSRALPDARDGLKPVHRRILYDMSAELGLYSDKPTRKSARIVGDVLGKFHPHGDSSVYDAMVRLAQEWSMRYPLVDGQGNFGSMDGDSPAAMRYTEARMKKITDEVMADIDKETVDWTLNFDDTIPEPTVLPTKIPLLIVNGASGIAVGMATNMAPHNLSEVVDACCAYIDNPEITGEEMLQYIKGPDFPTGGIIYGYEGVREAMLTGRGRVMMRAKTDIEHTPSGRECIVITEIPYMINKAEMIKKIADMINEKKIEGISYINDESDRNGLRIIIILKHDAVASVVLNTLFKNTPLQTSFAVNNIALVNGRPQMLPMRDLVKHFVDHRHDVVVRRARFDLKKAEERAHILEGLRRAVDIVDEIIAAIRACKGGKPEAKSAIMEKFGFDDPQATAIVNFQLGQLAGLEILKIENELGDLHTKIDDWRGILADDAKVLQVVEDELNAMREKYGDDRRTEIAHVSGEVDIEDLIPEEESVFTLTHAGYIKRQPSDTYQAQRRGGRGITALSRKDEDFVEELFLASTHDYILFVTDMGRVYRLKGYQVYEGSRTSRGVNIVNLLPLQDGEQVTSMLRVPGGDNAEGYLTMVTKAGVIKRTALANYSNIRKNGLIAINLNEGDSLAWTRITSGEDELIVATRNGMAIRISENDARPLGRTATGVRAIRLKEGDSVVGVGVVREGATVLTVTEEGKGRRTDVRDYRTQYRGGLGIRNYGSKGHVAGLKVIDDTDDIILISLEGIIIRMHVEDINVQSRYGSGVRVMRLGEGDRVVTVARTEHSDEEETAKPEDDGAEEELSAEELAALEAEEAQNAAGEEDAAPEDGE